MGLEEHLEPEYTWLMEVKQRSAALKPQRRRSSNLYLFCSLSSCTVLPWSSSCARVPVLEGTCSEEEVCLQKTPNPNGMEEESKANLNTTCPHLPKNKAEGEVSRLWTVSKAAVGLRKPACAVPVTGHHLCVRSAWPGVRCVKCVWVSLPKQLYKRVIAVLLPALFPLFIHHVVGAVSGSSVKPQSDDFHR